MKTIFDKPYVWSFLGQVKGKPTRENMLAELKQVRGEHFIHITERWNDQNQIEVKKYKEILSDSIFVPCPSGWGGARGLKDCFRLYEALEAGSIPIVEKDDFAYFDKFFPNHPILQTPDDWLGISDDMESLLEEPKKLQEYNEALIKWWQDYKSNLKTEIKNKFLNSKKNISVIIPTIWQANEYLKKSLISLESNAFISEVLIVNNEASQTPSWISDFKKVKILNQKKNLYFNGSLNLAIPLCQSELCCVLNDDANIDNDCFEFMLNQDMNSVGAVFIDPACIKGEGVPDSHLFSGRNFNNEKLLKPYDEFFNHGPGMIFFLKPQNFKPIPEELKHHCGDRYIFQSNKNAGLKNLFIQGFQLKIPSVGSASRSSANIESVIRQDYVARDKIFNLKQAKKNVFEYIKLDLNYSPKNKWKIISHKLKSGSDILCVGGDLLQVSDDVDIKNICEKDIDIALSKHNYSAWGQKLEGELSSCFIYIKSTPQTISLIDSLLFQIEGIKTDQRFFSYSEQYIDLALEKSLTASNIKFQSITNDKFAVSEEIYGKNIEHYKSNPPAYINFDRNVYTEELKKIYFNAYTNIK